MVEGDFQLLVHVLDEMELAIEIVMVEFVPQLHVHTPPISPLHLHYDNTHQLTTYSTHTS